MLGMTVARMLRRKRKITITTRATVSTSVNCTSSTDARIVVVRSVRISTLTAAGSAAVKVDILTDRTTTDRKSTRLNSSHQITSYAVFSLKKKMTLVRIPI